MIGWKDFYKVRQLQPQRTVEQFDSFLCFDEGKCVDLYSAIVFLLYFSIQFPDETGLAGSVWLSSCTCSRREPFCV